MRKTAEKRFLGVLKDEPVLARGQGWQGQGSQYQSARPVITKYHSPGGLDNRNPFLPVLEAGSSRSRCQQSWFAVRPVLELRGVTFLLQPHLAFLLLMGEEGRDLGSLLLKRTLAPLDLGPPGSPLPPDASSLRCHIPSTRAFLRVFPHNNVFWAGHWTLAHLCQCSYKLKRTLSKYLRILQAASRT